jgi:hypothetical protein
MAVWWGKRESFGLGRVDDIDLPGKTTTNYENNEFVEKEAPGLLVYKDATES